MTEANMSRLLAAIGDLDPRFRLHPNHPPLPDNPVSLREFKNLILSTRLGMLDVLATVDGVGGFDEVATRSVTVELFEHPTRILGLDALIDAKRAAGREKDKLGLIHLQAMKRHLDERNV
jgi:hypothetical protein